MKCIHIKTNYNSTDIYKVYDSSKKLYRVFCRGFSAPPEGAQCSWERGLRGAANPLIGCFAAGSLNYTALW